MRKVINLYLKMIYSSSNILPLLNNFPQRFMKEIIARFRQFAGRKESLFLFTKKKYSKLFEKCKFLQINWKEVPDQKLGFIFADTAKPYPDRKLIINKVMEY